MLVTAGVILTLPKPSLSGGIISMPLCEGPIGKCRGGGVKRPCLVVSCVPRKKERKGGGDGRERRTVALQSPRRGVLGLCGSEVSRHNKICPGDYPSSPS